MTISLTDVGVLSSRVANVDWSRHADGCQSDHGALKEICRIAVERVCEAEKPAAVIVSCPHGHLSMVAMVLLINTRVRRSFFKTPGIY